MTTTEITADQISPSDTIEATFAGVTYRGAVRAIDPAAYSTARYGSEHLLITFIGGGAWVGQDQSITVPSTQLVKRL